jgi:hypothetical protein
MRGLLVRLDWEAIRPPSIEAALEEFDSRVSHGESSMKMVRLVLSLGQV